MPLDEERSESSFCLGCGAFAPEYPASGACVGCGSPMLRRGASKRLDLAMLDPESERRTPSLPADVQAASNDPKNLFGKKYVLVRRIGSGGMGLVWKAWELPLSRYVAIKFLKAPSREDVVRFEREARLAAALDHPNIIPVYEFGQSEGQYFLVMKFIDGRPLDDAELDERGLLEVMISVCRAVHSAHEAGVIHRDLKPQNVMLTAEGRPIVLDFGLARTVEGSVDVSVSGMVVGTPSYMPPEQAMGKREKLDPRSDVYGLGAILYYMVAGRPPFEADAPMEVLIKVLHEDLVPPRRHNDAVSPSLETIILKALEKDRDRRYASAAGLADDLERLATGRTILARPSARRWIPRVIRRNPVVVAGLVAAAVLIAALAFRRGPDPGRNAWLGKFLEARKGLEPDGSATADRIHALGLILRNDADALGADTGEVLEWFRGQSRSGTLAVQRLEELGRAGWPEKRTDASRLAEWAASMAGLLDGLPDAFRPVHGEFRGLEKRASRIARFPGSVTLRINVHPFARISGLTVGSRPFIRDGRIVDPAFGTPSDQDLTCPIAIQELELDTYELELVHPELGKRSFSVPKSALQAGRGYLIRGEMSPGKTLELETIP